MKPREDGSTQAGAGPGARGRAGSCSSSTVPGAVPREVPVCALEPLLEYRFPKAICGAGGSH